MIGRSASSGDLPYQLDAVDFGQYQVEQHQPRLLGPDDARQVPRRAGHERGVAGLESASRTKCRAAGRRPPPGCAAARRAPAPPT